MAFAGVHDLQAGLAPGGEQLAIGLDGAAKLRDVVAEHLAEPARLEEVALHIDDEQRTFGGHEFKRIRLGINAEGC